MSQLTVSPDINDFIATYKVKSLKGLIDYAYEYSEPNFHSLLNVLKGEQVWRGNSEGIVRLKEAFSAKIDKRKYLVPVSSCSSGIFMLLRYFITGEKRKVIIPSYSWHAVLRAVINAGGEPVFWDLDTESLKLSEEIPQINPDEVACCLVSHLFGITCLTEQSISALARIQAPVIIDSAQCVSNEINGLSNGSFSVASVYSFNGSKHIPVGEGGMIVTDSSEINAFCENFMMNVYDSSTPSIERYNLKSQGWNFRLSALQASLAASLIHELDSRKERSSAFYSKLYETLGRTRLFKPVDYNREFFYLGFPVIAGSNLYGNSKKKLRDFAFYLFKSIGIEVGVWMNQPLSSIWKASPGNEMSPNSTRFAENHLVFKEVKKFHCDPNGYFELILFIDNLLSNELSLNDFN